MTRAASVLAACVLVVAGCKDPVTEIVLEVDSDLSVPGELDRLEVSVWPPDMPGAEPRRAEADLAAEGGELPRTLTLHHTGGPLGPYAVRVAGLEGTGTVVERDLALTFEEGESLRLRVMLDGDCGDTSCTGGTTCACPSEAPCASPSCRPVEVRPCEFEGRVCEDAGVPPDADPRDAGSDACGPVEECNGLDDDCDGEVDETFDLDTDELNCGRCGRVCPTEGDNAAGGFCEAGSCVLDCDTSWGDCNREPADGCETDTDTSMDHCGACGSFCPSAGTFHATDAVCSGGRCLLSCDADWGDCDEDRSTGCETHVSVDDDHCGTCDNACLDGERCRDNVCS